MYAASAGHVECVRTLRQGFNADPILENSDKKTARKLAEDKLTALQKAGTLQDNRHADCVETNLIIGFKSQKFNALNFIATANFAVAFLFCSIGSRKAMMID